MIDATQTTKTRDWEMARGAWPGIDIPESVFFAFVDGVGTPPPEGHPARPCDEILRDLYLTCACASGNAVAIARFDAQYGTLVERVRSRFGVRAPPSGEFRADVQAYLFAPRAAAAPRIVEYAGWVPLGSWLRVVVTRLSLNHIAATKPEEAYEDRIFEALLVTNETPEHAFMHREAQATFRGALKRAIGELGGRDRELLRFAFVQGLTIDEVASLYGVHRTSAFRWIKRASDHLSAALEHVVRAELGLSAEAYARWCAELRSQLDVTIERYLTTTG